MHCLVPASRLLDALIAVDLEVSEIVRRLLTARPADSRGAERAWPPLNELTVRRLLGMSLRQRGAEVDSLPMSGFSAAVGIVADELSRYLVEAGELPEDGFLFSEAQLDALHEATAAWMGAAFSQAVDSALRAKRSPLGFYRKGPITSSGEVHKRLTNPAYALAGSDMDELLVQQLEGGHVLRAWRCALPSAKPGHRVYDVIAVLTDPAGQASAYAEARVVLLPKSSATEAVATFLGEYEHRGEQLGNALSKLVASGRVDTEQLFDGAGLFFLESIEVRDELRGEGLGRLMLQALMPVAVSNLPVPVTKMALRSNPLQFRCAPTGMPAAYGMEVAEAAAALARYLDEIRPQDNLPCAEGSSLLYLDTLPPIKSDWSVPAHLMEG
jgi:GNAT superfamily N-acetyltransferase